MGFQWIRGIKPKHIPTTKVLVLGPKDFIDSDYPLLKKVLDDFTLRVEDVAAVVTEPGGVGAMTLRWANSYKWTCILLPKRNYGSERERDEDLQDVLNKDYGGCVWFRDDADKESRRLWNLIRPKSANNEEVRV